MIHESAKSGSRPAQFYYAKLSDDQEYGLKPTSEGFKYLSEAVSAHFAPALIFWNEKCNTDDMLLKELIELDVGGSGTELLPGENINAFVPYI